MTFFLAFLLAALLVTLTHANNEKAIFLAPARSTILTSDSFFAHAGPSLQSIDPTEAVLKTSLDVVFVNETHPRGLQSWYLLRNLQEGQRYEVRVCWAAIQPTEFWIHTFTPQEVKASAELSQSLDQYVSRRIGKSKAARNLTETLESVLFLRLSAAADFFTSNDTLMQHPPRVDAEIVLDPYLLNIFPRSLGPIAVYLLAIAVIAWYLSAFVAKGLTVNPTVKAHGE